MDWVAGGRFSAVNVRFGGTSALCPEADMFSVKKKVCFVP
jgi:hypothetical protein